MSPLRNKIDEVRRRVRQLVVLRGCAYLLTIVILGILAACCADAFWRLDVIAVRVSLLILLALSALAGGGVLLVHPWLKTIHDAELARQMERCRAGSLRSLASGVEFDGTGCDTDRGARRLQQAVIEQQTRRLDAEVVTELVDTKPVQRSVIWALAACVLATGALLADRPRAALALHRLFVPLGAPTWPREHTLRLLDEDFQPLSPAEPLIVADGRTPTLYVEDISGRLPEQIVLQFRSENGEIREQELVADAVEVEPATQSRRVAAFSVPAEEGFDRLRASGGDDERMPWHFVQRITPPAIAQLDLKIHPPDYTNQSAHVVTGPAGPLEALIGTVVEIELSPNKELKNALLRRDGQPGQQLQERNSPERSYFFTWEIREPGRTAFWFELTDQFGLQNLPPTRLEMLGVEDREPVVSIEHPPVNTTLTPTAVVPFRCVAEDDVGLSQVRLLYSDPPGSEGTQLYPLPSVDEGVLRADLKTTLSMVELGAHPGANIVFRAEAIDGYDGEPAHVGQSGRHNVLIVTPEEKLHELLNREIGVSEAIERAIAMQTDSARHTRQLRLQWNHTSRLRPEDLDLLSRVIHDSSRTEVELYDERRGAESRVAAIHDELDWNRLDDEATQSRLDLVSTELRRLRTDAIPVLHRSLANARKSSTTADEEATVQQVADALVAAEAVQVDIYETLQMLLGMLRGWRERYDLVRSLAEVSDDQDQLNLETAGFGQPLLERDERNDQDEADFARFADRQQHLADQLAELTSSAIQSAGEGAQEGSVDRDSLLRLAEALEQSSAGDEMVRATELLRNHNIGEAMTAQAALSETLRSLTESLDQWEPLDPETLLKQIEQADQEMETLQQRQADALENAASMSLAAPRERSDAGLQRLRREQQEIADQTAESALRLRKQGLAGAAASSSQASEAMRAAAQGLQDDITDAAINHQREALDDLQQTREELARLRQSLEMRYAMQQVSELSATLTAFHARQLQLHEHALQLADVLEQAGRLQRSQLSALSTLKRTQSELADDVSSLTTDMDERPAFRIVLNAAVEAMHSADERLTPDLLTDALPFQVTAAQRFTEIIDALDREGAGAAPPIASPGGQDGDEQQSLLDWTLIAQIRLLQGMQSRIAARIAELTSAASEEPALTEEQQSELDELSILQGQAARVAADLLAAATGGTIESANPDLEEVNP